MRREGGPSPEEMGLKPEETRILSDAELFKGGARVQDKGRLELTVEQVAAAKDEMNIAEAEKRANQMFDTYPQVWNFLDAQVALFHSDVAQAEAEMNAPTTTNAERREKERLIEELKADYASYEEALAELGKGKLGPAMRVITERAARLTDSNDPELNVGGRSVVDKLLGEFKTKKPF